MFKKSYNVANIQKKNEASSSSSNSSSSSTPSTMTLKKKEKIKAMNNQEAPEYRQKIYPKKTVTKWVQNKTYAEKTPTKKNEESKKEIPTKKKLERK